MRIIAFPGRDDVGPDENWLSALDAALSGAAEGSAADSWRELREDVRALAPPISPEFERELSDQILERGEHSVERGGPSVERGGRSAFEQPQGHKQPYGPKESHRAGRSHRRFGRLRPAPATLAAVSVACVMIVAVLIAAPWRTAGHRVERAAQSSSAVARADRLGQASSSSAESASVGVGAGKASPSVAGAGAAVSGGTANASPAKVTNAPVESGAAASPGRVQQLGASITLAASTGEVQTVADRVARLAVSEGGFVQSSHVNQGEKTGEASLMLSVPSTKLSAALASLGQLAPVRGESQSLQDITNAYDADRQRLNDATAERQALLRALAKASTAGEVDSLRERLAQNRGAIARARSTLQAISQQASTAEIEVTVLGDRSTSGEGLTLHRGLHDAGRVLTVALVVLLIAAAILAPLALLIAALATARGAWLRYRRERVLDGR
jgi:hypothetical protein